MRTAQLDNYSFEPENISTFAFAKPEPSPDPTYYEWFCEEILPSRWLTYFVAFIVHWIAILSLAAIYLDLPIYFTPVTLNAVISDSEPLESSALEIQTTDIDDAAMENADVTPEALTMSASTIMSKLDQDSLDEMPDSLAALAPNARGAESAEKAGAQPKQNVVFANAPKNAVSAGSFSVWTEPDNPDPGEPYKIIVQIRLPDGTERYSVTDLEGVVVGSDGYQKLIPGNLRGFLPVHEGQARFEVHIVSADENVLDTVFVRSKVLREAQKLQLRF